MYFGNLDLFITWGITPIGQTRDSDALTRSNYRRILTDMQESFPDDVTDFSANHWAVGWTEQILVRVLMDEDAGVVPDRPAPDSPTSTQPKTNRLSCGPSRTRKPACPTTIPVSEKDTGYRENRKEPLMSKNLKEFLATYNPHGEHPVTEIETSPSDSGHSPFIIVRHGPYTIIVNPLAPGGPDDHLCIDLHSFKDGEDATAGVFGMTEGKRWSLPDTGATSHGWPSANLVAVVLGEQKGSVNG